MQIEYIKKNDKIIGSIIDNVYYSIRENYHFMNKFNGFGISEKLLFYLDDKGIKDIIIVYKKVNYRCSVTDFIISNKVYTFYNENGEDIQRFININDMEIVK